MQIAPITSTQKGKSSLVVLWCLIAWFTIYPITNKWNNPIAWDAFGYYLYLPATFIWKDPVLKDFSPVEKINKKYNNTSTYYQGGKTTTGNWMIKYTAGEAVLEAPFFFVAHVLAPKFNYEADGFSKPYQIGFLFSHFFYLILGFVFLRKALCRLFDDKLVALLLLLLLLGTNYTITAVLTPGMPHVTEFALFSLILYLTIRWHEKSSKALASIMGIAIGLVVLIRPTDIVIVFLPLLWNVSSLNSLKEKIVFIFRKHKIDILLIVFFCALLGFIQLYYWKQVAGKWLLMSYSNNPGEGFEFLSPYILNVLFSFRKGWLVYTPLMIFALAGFWPMYKHHRNVFWAVVLFFVFNLYVVASWSCWWYADSFGQRAMVDSYAILLLPLGYFLKYNFFDSTKRIKRITLSVIVFFIFLNLFQNWQFTNNIIDGSRMTAAYYYKVFGKTVVDEKDKELLLVNRNRGEKEVFSEEKEYVKKELFSENFEKANSIQGVRYIDSVAHTGKRAVLLDSAFSKNYKLETAYKNITKKDHAWIRISFWYYVPQPQTSDSLMQMVVTFINYKNWPYKHAPVVIGQKNGFKEGQWNEFVFDYMTPEVRSVEDKINIYFCPYGTIPVFLDDIKVEAFEKTD